VAATTTLNPNAKSFVPPLNPHAKEFHPKGTSDQILPKTPEKESVTAEEKESEMKPAGDRRATPWIQPPPPPDESDQEDFDDDDFDSPIAAYVSSEDEDSAEDEEDEDEQDSSRVRQISVGSDDSDYNIVFGTSSEQVACENCDKQQPASVKLSLQDFVVSESASDVEDEVDASVIDSADVLSVFQAQQLSMDRLLSPAVTVVTSTPDDDGRIRAANRSWNDHYNSPLSSAAAAAEVSLPRSASKVCFAPADANTVIYEDPELAAELAASRQSDFPQRQADKERMERLIGPILTETHRDKVRNRLLGL